MKKVIETKQLNNKNNQVETLKKMGVTNRYLLEEDHDNIVIIRSLIEKLVMNGVNIDVINLINSFEQLKQLSVNIQSE